MTKNLTHTHTQKQCAEENTETRTAEVEENISDQHQEAHWAFMYPNPD